MTLALIFVLFAGSTAPLALRWARAQRGFHEAAAKSTGIEFRSDPTADPLTQSRRLYSTASWLDEQFSLGHLHDPETLRRHRVMQNRLTVLIVTAAFSLPSMFVAVMVDSASGGLALRFRVAPMLLITLAMWAGASCTTALIMRGDRTPRWKLLALALGVVGGIGGLILAYSVVVGL